MVLQNEQGMAFARAVAAGFNAENMADLISFAECFGAKRMLKACLKFTELWKTKRETDQWLDIQASEAMSMKSEFPSMSSIDINLSPDTKKHNDFTEQWAACNHGHSKESNENFTDERTPGNSQVPLYPHMYFLGQFPHPMFPHCPFHSPPGAPPFQPYHPMQGMPCYQNHPGGSLHFPPTYTTPSGDCDPRSNTRQRMESGGATAVSEEEDHKNSYDLEKARSVRESQRRGQSARRKLGENVSRHADCNNSEKRRNASDTESCSAASEDEREEDLPSRIEGSRIRSSGGRSPPEEETNPEREVVDSGDWQVFQNFLLRNDQERASGADAGLLLSGEKERLRRKRQSKHDLDAILRPERGLDTGDSEASRRCKRDALNDEKNGANGDSDVLLDEVQGERGAYKRRGSNEFAVYEQDELPSNRRFSDLLAQGRWSKRKSSSCNAPDESFVVPLRSDSTEQQRRDNRGCGIAVDMFVSRCTSAAKEFPPNGIKNQPDCGDPDDLSLMPARGMEEDLKEIIMTRAFTAGENGTQAKEGSKKGDKGKRSMTGLEKQKAGSMLRKRGNPSKLSPLAEAQARANKLRAFKADLQRAKKEKVKIGPAKENPKSVRFSLSDEPYQPQHRRAASLGEPCARNVSHEAPRTVGSATGKLDLSRSAESRLEEVHENEGRPRGRETLKGLRKLLKFGRRSRGTSLGDSGLETCSLYEDDQMASSSFTEVAAALKNSVSMEEGHSEGTTPPKAFRRFSILSPFRSRSGGGKKSSAP
ncbi:unnamed protein product [Spirodela intermedia]|uniref:Uncharacterized protein n=1 Tax=Spirodela intermedia TaxID=51605 RepID=A0A7I8J8C1_SPIIN|nr:unnamed protein product [Spirodela intermedia]CAA6666456.1 unnamed protein product [Spirodela intermedia]